MKFKNANQAKKYYINLLMETCTTEQEFKEQEQRYKNIIGCSGKPKASKKQMEFVEFVKNNIYKGNTTADRLCKHFKIVFTDRTKLEQDIIKKAGSLENAQKIYNDFQKETSDIINKAFDRNLKTLQKILK